MNWQIQFLPEAEKDFRKLDGSQRILVQKALKKVSTNPLPISEGGYGKPLGNHNKTHLSNILKVKLKDAGIRIVYTLIQTNTEMLIIVIGARKDESAYIQAQHRVQKYHL